MAVLRRQLLLLLLVLGIGLSARAQSDAGESAESSTEPSLASDSPDFVYRTPDLELDRHHLYEHFDDEQLFQQRWVRSKVRLPDSKQPKYDGEWELTDSHGKLKGDRAVMMASRARHHAIAAKLRRPFEFKRNALVVQYEVQFRAGQDCGGAYLKLLTAPSGRLDQLQDSTPYTIMFGPDKCGNDRKLHFIFKHRHPVNGTLREIHFNRAASVPKLEEVFTDGRWHIFRLTIRPDNSFEIQMDKKPIVKGDLLSDFRPPVNPPKEIDDPADQKPEDWDDRERIPDPDSRKPVDWDEHQPRKLADPSAVKPAGWLEDEAETVPDRTAVKPADWDPEMDGEWEAPLVANPACTAAPGCGAWKAPLIDNPKYRGKWKPPLIANPNFKGQWAPRKMPNPDFFEDPFPFKMAPIDALAFEVWTISNQIAFDNVLVTDSVDVANFVLDHTFQIKKELSDAETDHWFVKMVKQTNKQPWLWIIYVLAIAVPLLLFIGYCCVTPGKHRHAEEPTVGAEKPADEPSYEEFLEAKQRGFEGEFNYIAEEDEEEELGEEVEEPTAPTTEPDEAGDQPETRPRLRKNRARKDD